MKIDVRMSRVARWRLLTEADALPLLEMLGTSPDSHVPLTEDELDPAVAALLKKNELLGSPTLVTRRPWALLDAQFVTQYTKQILLRLVYDPAASRKPPLSKLLRLALSQPGQAMRGGSRDKHSPSRVYRRRFLSGGARSRESVEVLELFARAAEAAAMSPPPHEKSKRQQKRLQRQRKARRRRRR